MRARSTNGSNRWSGVHPDDAESGRAGEEQATSRSAGPASRTTPASHTTLASIEACIEPRTFAAGSTASGPSSPSPDAQGPDPLPRHQGAGQENEPPARRQGVENSGNYSPLLGKLSAPRGLYCSRRARWESSTAVLTCGASP